ncbi:hypothetical protein ACEPAH_5488 [Sanghuangporus vaninii]
MLCAPWHFIVFVLSLILELAQALPQWDGFWGSSPQISIGSLVPGATVIEAITEGIDSHQYRPKYLSIPAEKGAPGPAAIFEHNSPPLFYIHNGQLWQPTNLTSILRVNVLNVTSIEQKGIIHPAPLKIEISEEPKGLDGTWRWSGTKLYFEVGNRSNKGLYFSCVTNGGARALYTALEDMPVPYDCKFTTLHSFSDRPERPR